MATKGEMEEKVYLSWVNSFLEEVDQKIKDLRTGFADGVQLMNLLTVLSGKPAPKKLKEGVKNKAQMADNVTQCLEFIKELGMRSSCTAMDVVDGKKKEVLALVWLLIRFYQLTLTKYLGADAAKMNSIPSIEGEAKDGIISWVKSEIGVKLDNLRTLRDGVVLCKIINKHEPGTIPDEILNGGSVSARLEGGFEAALQKFNVPRILKVAEFKASHERLVAIYFAEFGAAVKGHSMRKKQWGSAIRKVQSVSALKAVAEAAGSPVAKIKKEEKAVEPDSASSGDDESADEEEDYESEEDGEDESADEEEEYEEEEEEEEENEEEVNEKLEKAEKKAKEAVPEEPEDNFFTNEKVENLREEVVKSVEEARKELKIMEFKKANEINVGVYELPIQIHKKTMAKGFDFNIIFVGETGLGKTTFINTLFIRDLLQARPKKDFTKPPPTLDVKTYERVIVENGVSLHLTLVDTPGFGAAINNEETFIPLLEYIDSQYETYMRNERKIQERYPIKDVRIHACLYFIDPTGPFHGLKALDVDFMTRLCKKVNLIPVIAKADTMTRKDLKGFKELIRKEIDFHGISIYEFPEFQDELSGPPFAVVGSTDEVMINGSPARARKYGWGVCEVENPDHSDFSTLRDLLIRNHLVDLIDYTHKSLYESYRTNRMQHMDAKKFSSAEAKEKNDKFQKEKKGVKEKWAAREADLKEREEKLLKGIALHRKRMEELKKGKK